MPHRSSVLGAFAIAMAIGFNLPYVDLVSIYDYPDIMRRPAGEALSRFAAGGTELILTWHASAWAALLLAPLSIGLALTPANRATSDSLEIAAAITGALSGMAQAIGLWRWVFVIPGLARRHAEGDASAAGLFDILNAWGGVAIGQHLGQWLLVFFVLALSVLQWRQGDRLTGGLGFATTITIAIGTMEGLAMAMGRAGEMFSLFAVAGSLGLSLIGLGMIGVYQPPERP